MELRRNERIEKAKKQRGDERKDAERALAEARKFEESLRNKIRKNTADLKKNRNGLAAAKANLEKTKSQFQRLADEKIELVSGICLEKPLLPVPLLTWPRRTLWTSFISRRSSLASSENRYMTWIYFSRAS